MKIAYEPQADIKAFIEDHIERCQGRGLHKGGAAIGVLNDDNDLIGGFYYHDYDPDAGVIEISGASATKKWLSRPILFALFAYPFIGLKCQLVAMRHSAKDKPLARMLRAYGFKQVTVPRLFGRNDDAIISTLTVEDWSNSKFHKDIK